MIKINEKKKAEKAAYKIKECLSNLDKKSIEAIRKFLVTRFGDDEDFPEVLKTLEEKAEVKKSS